MGSVKYSVLKPKYESRFAQLQVRPKWIDRAVSTAKQIAANKSRYDPIGAKVGVPWFFIGVIHSLECGLSFSKHPHNGDPLTARTIRAPSGRPRSGSPPFTFEFSAEDAIGTKQKESWQSIPATDWGIAAVLWRLESYNGWGYEMHDRANPYLWSGSQFYGDPPDTGKYISDNNYSPTALSQQLGAATILKQMVSLGFLDAKNLSAGANLTDVPNGGLQCIDGGVGGGQTFSMQNPQSLFEAMQVAFGLDRKSRSLARSAELRLDASADPRILELEAQKTFRLLGVHRDLEGEYLVREALFTVGDYLEVKIIANSPDPNAPPPQVFTQGGTLTGTAAPAVGGSLNERIYQAANSVKGSDTSSGPGRGKVACAWAINNLVLKTAGIKPIGKNPDYVTSVEEDLKSGRGQRVEIANAQNGDILIMGANSRAHIGIFVGKNSILSNSSSKARFTWIADVATYERRYGTCTAYRVVS